MILHYLLIFMIFNYITCLRRPLATSFNKNIRYFSINPSKYTLNAHTASESDYSSPFYITTPIYYVNGDPHLGHAYTSVVSDIIARFWKLDNRKVYFLTGTDEHGQKVEQSAMKLNNIDNLNSIDITKQFVDKMSNKFRSLSKALNLSNNDFIRTTEDRHKQAVQHLWKVLEDNNHIYLGSYEGWYSVRDEAFYGESELVNGKAPTGADVEWVKEESYFFRLSAFTNKLLDYYESNPDFIYPKGRRNEVIAFVNQEGGLKDLSISRTTFQWGIPVPNNNKHVIYVWLDALTNYLSALGYPYNTDSNLKDFWPASLHIVGKDILRFHAIYWPAFLLAANIELPKRVFAHGWWTKNGEKMSKSLGNVIDPLELIEKYGLDNFRYFLIAEVNFGNDGDFSDESISQRINSDLANDIGNLYQRVLIFISKHSQSIIPQPDSNTYTDEDVLLLKNVKNLMNDIRESIHQQNMKQYCDFISQLSRAGNKYIDSAAPWSLVKDPNLKPRLDTVLYILSELCRQIGILIQPIMPDTSSNMLDQLGIPSDKRTFSHLTEETIVPGSKIGTPTPIFKKFDIVNNNDNNQPIKSNNKLDNNKNKSNKKINNNLVENYMKLSLNDISDNIVTTSEDIRLLKTQNSDKAIIQSKIEILLALKESYKRLNNGVEYETNKSS